MQYVKCSQAEDQNYEYHCAECHYDEGHCAAMLIVVMPSAVMLSGIVKNVIIKRVILLSSFYRKSLC